MIVSRFAISCLIACITFLESAVKRISLICCLKIKQIFNNCSSVAFWDAARISKAVSLGQKPGFFSHPLILFNRMSLFEVMMKVYNKTPPGGGVLA